MVDFNTQIITEFRANGGTVTTAGFGDGLILLHTTGAKTGEPRISPLRGIPTDGGWLVAASKAGAPEEPGWAHNLRAHPSVVVETGNGELQATAIELREAERDAAWQQFVDASPAFAAYQEAAGARTIAVFHLLRA